MGYLFRFHDKSHKVHLLESPIVSVVQHERKIDVIRTDGVKRNSKSGILVYRQFQCVEAVLTIKMARRPVESTSFETSKGFIDILKPNIVRKYGYINH